ncbi:MULTISPECIES: FliC/FljB family flagellin [Yersinia]|nr:MULTISPECIES: FliC/FljB family flagellin [Yersinia]MDN0103082.1 FliC/FljB family flagellin [Yersinia bercovieri]QDW33853.1 FliC/FljB family flagellin [Yersinia sp. KBS0713]QKJ07946.1 FliC/FljB family flagellin [Yersinia bercovieri ATCC 43970]CFQ36639.1 flagellin [Yersinia bercovieri]CNE49962.1 flagellin [Yersinia bercovieri]
MSVINTNILSLNTQNNMTKSQSALGSAIERLSSGLRINSAKDDAAGQAIANRFTSNIRGLTQAARNANDGISVAQTTEGALNEINNNLQRVRELTVQASTGSNSTSDLSSIQDEIQLRMDEIDRVSAQTQFNGVKVLSSDTKMSIQVGANDNETIDISLKEVTSKTLNLEGFNVTGPKGGATAALAAADFQKAFGATTAMTTATSAETTDGALAARLGVAKASVTVGTAPTKDSAGNWFTKVDIKANDATEANNLKANGFDIASGATKSFYIAVDPQTADTTTTAATAAISIDTASLSLKKLTTGATNDPLKALDAAISDIDVQRSSLGAVQNRFQSTVTNLNNTVNNLTAAQSRIQDADYATEVSNMSRAQILQQAGTSVLAQANQVPQTVLSLLR